MNQGHLFHEGMPAQLKPEAAADALQRFWDPDVEPELRTALLRYMRLGEYAEGDNWRRAWEKATPAQRARAVKAYVDVSDLVVGYLMGRFRENPAAVVSSVVQP